MAATVVPSAAEAQRSGLMINGYWAGWMNQAQVLQTLLPTEGMGAQITVQTNYLAPVLLNFIAASLVGKSSPTSLQLATYDYNLQPVSGLKIGTARIQEVDLPAANATDSPVMVGVTFAPALFESGKPTTGPMESNPLHVVLHSSYFRMQIDSLDAAYVTSVSGVAVRLPDALKGINLPQLVVTYNTSPTNAYKQAFVSGLQKWYQSQTTRNGMLTFYMPDLKTILLVVRYRGLRVTSINTPTSGPSTATFAMTGISVQGAAMP